jgi:putative heme-binding domain-containing protein
MWTIVLLVALVTPQEHSYTQADIENGARLYQSSCAGCHGPGGDMVPGIELLRGQFRRASSDTDVMTIIKTGIPGTTMPPSSFTDAQAQSIVAFLRTSAPGGGRGGATVARGDAAKGRTIFDGKGQCATCHRVNGVGPRVAPELTDIGAIRPAAELEQKLLDPNALVRPANRTIEVVTKDGTTITGHLLNQDTFSIQLIDGNERLLSLPKAQLRGYTYVKASTMPSYRERLAAAEIADVVAYLVSLKGQRP